MRKIVMGLVCLATAAACSSGSRGPSPASPPSPAARGTNLTGGADPRAAVDAYLAAAKAQDLQAMAGAWGTREGAARDNNVMTRDELEKRELIVMRCFRYDDYQIASEAPAASGERVLVVVLRRGPLTRSTNFHVVPGPNNRWYVMSVDLEPLRELCTER